MGAVWSSDPARDAGSPQRVKQSEAGPPNRGLKFAADEIAPEQAASAKPDAGLAAYLLGPFRVEVHGRPPRWNGNKAKSIFKYLVLHRRQRVPKEVLMEIVWPDADPEASRLSLKVAVSSLRGALSACVDGRGQPHEWIISDGDAYLFEPGLPLWVDAEEFEAQSLLAQRLAEQGSPPAMVAACKTAVALYRGDFLEDNRYEEWALLERERLRDLYLQDLVHLTKHLIELEQWHEGIMYLHKILSVDPCQEETFRHLMICHAALGQLGRVRQLHTICHQVIRSELDSAPSPEIDELLERLTSETGQTVR